MYRASQKLMINAVHFQRHCALYRLGALGFLEIQSVSLILQAHNSINSSSMLEASHLITGSAWSFLVLSQAQ